MCEWNPESIIISMSTFFSTFVNILSTFWSHFVNNLLCHQTNRQRKFLLFVVRPVHWMHSSEVDCCQDMTVSLAPSSGDSLIVALLNLADMSLWALLKLFLGSHLQYFWNKIWNSKLPIRQRPNPDVGQKRVTPQNVRQFVLINSVLANVRECRRCQYGKCLIEIQRT